MALEALSREIRSECPEDPEELLYTDDLALESLKSRLEAWKRALKSKGLRVNVKKTKMMISSESARELSVEGKFP